MTTILHELARAKALFQMRAIAAAIGCPSIIRDVDGDGLMLTVEPLQHIANQKHPSHVARGVGGGVSVSHEVNA